MTVFRLRNLVQWAVGKTLTSTYDPPEIHDPSPENMIADTLYLAEHHLYGSSRLGIKQYADSLYYTVYGTDDTLLNVPTDWYSYTYADWMQKNKASAYINNEYFVSSDTASSLNRLGTKQYELTDHLGNVVVTVLDRRTGIGNVGGLYTGWRADVHSVSDYYPFGMPMISRTISQENYRFGYNQQERTDEISGKGNHNTAQFWEYDTRIARRWNVDPVIKEYESPYAAFGNNPIWLMDINGADTSVSVAGGGGDITIDEKIYDLEFYEANEKYNINGSDVESPVKENQLRSFSHTVLGKFSAHWNTSGDKPSFAGYLNKDGKDVETVIKETNEVLSSFKFKFLYAVLTIGNDINKYIEEHPLEFALEMSIPMLTRATEVSTFSSTSSRTTITKFDHIPRFFGYTFRYASRVRVRALQDPTSHNFPYSFDPLILYTKPLHQGNGYHYFRLPGYMNGKAGVFEIGVKKGNLIDHRFFRPYPIKEK